MIKFIIYQAKHTKIFLQSLCKFCPQNQSSIESLKLNVWDSKNKVKKKVSQLMQNTKWHLNVNMKSRRSSDFIIRWFFKNGCFAYVRVRLGVKECMFAKENFITIMCIH